MLKMAAEFPSRRDQLIFLINNYDMMLSVLMVRPHAAMLSLPVQQAHHHLSLFLPVTDFNILTVVGVFSPFVQERAADDSKEVEGFQQLLLARTQVTITEELWEIGRLLSPLFALGFYSEIIYKLVSVKRVDWLK